MHLPGILSNPGRGDCAAAGGGAGCQRYALLRLSAR